MLTWMTLSILLTLVGSWLVGVNGWVRRYLIAMLVAGTAGHLTQSIYIYIIYETICLATILTISAGYLARVPRDLTWIVLISLTGLNGYLVSTQLNRASKAWGSVPLEVQIMLLSMVALVYAAGASLSAAKHLGIGHRRVATVLGSLWLGQAVSKILLISGFALHWPGWLTVNHYLGPGIVITGMTALLVAIWADHIHAQLIQVGADIEGRRNESSIPAS